MQGKHKSVLNRFETALSRLICILAYGTTCNDDSMLFHISNKLFNNMDVALSDFYLQDLKCQGEVDKKNPDVWIFNVTSLQSCGTKLSVSYVKLFQYFVSSPIIKFNFFFYTCKFIRVKFVNVPIAGSLSS